MIFRVLSSCMALQCAIVGNYSRCSSFENNISRVRCPIEIPAPDDIPLLGRLSRLGCSVRVRTALEPQNIDQFTTIEIDDSVQNIGEVLKCMSDLSDPFSLTITGLKIDDFGNFAPPNKIALNIIKFSLENCDFKDFNFNFIDGSALMYLSIIRTKFHHVDLSRVSSFGNLSHFAIERSNVSDVHLLQAGRIPNLTSLSIHEIGSCGESISSANYPSLKRLSLSTISLSVGSLRKMRSLSGLERLAVQYCKLSDTSLAELLGHGSLPRLSEIFLDANDFTSDGLHAALNNRDLRTLSLSKVAINEPAATDIKNMKNLESLYVTKSKIDSRLFDGFLSLGIKTISLRQCQNFTQDIFKDLSRLPNIETLNVSFSGPIDEYTNHIKTIASLKVLVTSDNQLGPTSRNAILAANGKLLIMD